VPHATTCENVRAAYSRQELTETICHNKTVGPVPQTLTAVPFGNLIAPWYPVTLAPGRIFFRWGPTAI
jgi:hypothetical protein